MMVWVCNVGLPDVDLMSTQYFEIN